MEVPHAEGTGMAVVLHHHQQHLPGTYTTTTTTTTATIPYRMEVILCVLHIPWALLMED